MKLLRTWSPITTATLSVGLLLSCVAATELVAQGSNDFDYWYDRCYELSRQEALSACNRAIDIKPNDAITWYNRGVVLYDLQRYAEAIKSYERAIAITPNDADAWYYRGLALFKLGKGSEAIKSFKRVLAINPRNKLPQCYLLFVISSEMSEVSRAPINTNEVYEVLRLADYFDYYAVELKSLVLEEEILNNYNLQLSRIYREFAQITRSLTRAWSSLDIAEVNLMQQRLQEVGEAESLLVEEMNDYCNSLSGL